MRAACATAAPDAPAVVRCCTASAPACTPGSRAAQALAARPSRGPFDLLGLRLSGADPGGTTRTSAVCQVLAALMERLGIERASLIGNSIGGKIAWIFAALSLTV